MAQRRLFKSTMHSLKMAVSGACPMAWQLCWSSVRRRSGGSSEQPENRASARVPKTTSTLFRLTKRTISFPTPCPLVEPRLSGARQAQPESAILPSGRMGRRGWALLNLPALIVLRHGVEAVPGSAAGWRSLGQRLSELAGGDWPKFPQAESSSPGILVGARASPVDYLFGFGAAAGSGCMVTPFGIMFPGLFIVIQGCPWVSLLTILPSTIMPHPSIGAVEGTGFGCWADAKPDARTRQPGKIMSPNRLTFDCCFILHLVLGRV